MQRSLPTVVTAVLLALLAAGPAAGPLAAQVPDPQPLPEPADTVVRPIVLPPPVIDLLIPVVPPIPVEPREPRPPVVHPASADAELRRLGQLRGTEPADGLVLRSSWTLGEAPEGDGWTWVAPRLRTAYNSDVPRSLNEGALWAGRGLGVSVASGAAARIGRVRLVLAPEVTWQQNADFEHPSRPWPQRTEFAPPWRIGDQSADLPVRFGPHSFGELTAGQSGISVDVGAFSLGWSNASHWWGPAVRNAVVLGANAPGFPHAVARTERPLATPLGELEAVWILGALRDSPFFEARPERNGRYLNGFAFSFSPLGEPNLSLGAARVVHGELARGESLVTRGFEALTRWRTVGDAGERNPARQLVSLFARWVFPEVGAEAYAEWGWTGEPTVREILTTTNRGQGYTLGMQWIGAIARGLDARVAAEVTNLEQDGSWIRSDPPASFYVGQPIPAGYTHRGRVLGAAIGPGASSQWAAFDLVRGSGALAGAFVERVRWDNDAYYTQATGFLAHDVSLTFGLRGIAPTRLGTVSATAGLERRHNYLFQNPTPDFSAEHAVDVDNWILRIEIRPRQSGLRPIPEL